MTIRVCLSSWINNNWIIVRLKKKITIFIYRYLSIRKKTLRRTLFIENENNESFHRKTTHLTRNRTRRNDELIESTWSSYSLLLFFSPREKTRIRNKDGFGWIIETSFYATRTIHHANCISCGDCRVISKKRINPLELRWWSFITIFSFLSFFFQNFLTFHFIARSLITLMIPFQETCKQQKFGKREFNARN